MKTAKKALLLVLCGCLLVAGSIIGTMAYLTDADTVTNTFTVGNVEIKLDEALTNEYGVADGSVRVPNADQKYEGVDGNEYKIIPGHNYVKDPTVTIVGGSEPAYVRMLVEVTNIDNLIGTGGVFVDKKYDNGTTDTGDDVDYIQNGVLMLQYLVNGWDDETWVSTKEVEKTATGSAIYEFRYNVAVGALEKDASSGEYKDVKLDALFDSFTIPGAIVTEKNIDKFDGVQIKVTAQAIQADGFTAKDGKTVEDVAWAAFDAQN